MSLKFVFDYRSPYAYLANTQLKSLPVTAQMLPVDIVAVMAIVGNQPSPKCPPKARYSGMDAGRWARRYGVPLSPNKAAMAAMGSGQIAADLFSRAAVAAQDLGVFDALHGALFSAYWVEPVDLVSEQGRVQLLRNQGIDVDVWAHAEQDAVRDALRSRVEAAAEQGVFGAPTFFVGEEMFFGNDRLKFVRDALTQGGAQ